MNSMIDVNVNLSQYPTRRLPNDTTPELVQKLKKHNIVNAWVGSYDALLHRDMEEVNHRLKEDCVKQGSGTLVPFGTVNPALPDWKEDLRRCVDEYQFYGIRLYPTYHQYLLSDKRFIELLHLSEDAGLIVQIVTTVEDARTQHPLLSVSKIDIQPLIKLIAEFPGLKLVLLNAFRDVDIKTVIQLAKNSNVYFDFAMLEGFQKLKVLINSVSIKQVLFGSYFPFYYLESAILKMKESQLDAMEIKQIVYDNASQLISD